MTLTIEYSHYLTFWTKDTKDTIAFDVMDQYILIHEVRYTNINGRII